MKLDEYKPIDQYKVSPALLDSTYGEAVKGAQKMILLGIIGEICKLEQPHGDFQRFVKTHCKAPLPTINCARMAVKKMFAHLGLDKPSTWSLLMTMSSPEKLFEIDGERLPPRMAAIQQKIKDFTINKSARTLEYEVGVRETPTNGHVSESEVEEIVRKKNPKPPRALPEIDPVKRTERLLFGGNAETQQKTALVGKIRELLDTDAKIIAGATTAQQRRNIASRLRLLAEKLEGNKV